VPTHETRLYLFAPFEGETAAFGLNRKCVAPHTIKFLQEDRHTTRVDVVERGSQGVCLPARHTTAGRSPGRSPLERSLAHRSRHRRSGAPSVTSTR
jgi:hypothetical protein